ncbi:MAG: hypothetical protein ACJ788_27990, partial [Ktedonobacteraceae bacterium]
LCKICQKQVKLDSVETGRPQGSPWPSRPRLWGYPLAGTLVPALDPYCHALLARIICNTYILALL